MPNHRRRTLNMLKGLANVALPYIGGWVTDFSDIVNNIGVPREMVEKVVDKSLNALHNYSVEANRHKSGAGRAYNGERDPRKITSKLYPGGSNWGISSPNPNREPNATMPSTSSKNYAPAVAYGNTSIPNIADPIMNPLGIKRKPRKHKKKTYVNDFDEKPKKKSSTTTKKKGKGKEKVKEKVSTKKKHKTPKKVKHEYVIEV